MLRRTLLLSLVFAAVGNSLWAADRAGSPLIVVVMDPLAGPLACDCVKGYAQRKYELLGEFLSQELKRPVQVYWSESLVKALADQTEGRADVIIGKHSVVLHDAAQAKRQVIPIASLTGTDGSTVQTGLIVVRVKDRAQTVADLGGYRILFGPADCDEKSLAPMVLLKEHGVSVPATPETSPSCSTAAAALMELPPEVNAAAVVSSYAQPLLEGCGTVKKGDLRVIGVSDPVPFITAFVNGALPESDRNAIRDALLDVATNADLMIGLETGAGFIEYKPLPSPGSRPLAEKTVSQASEDAKKKD